MRIIGGECRGRKLAEWHGTGIRPLRDQVRTALFDILSDLIPGSEFLDLFAGTGAVGLEALSRGARHATFVDNSPQAVRLIGENVGRLGYADRAEIIKADAILFVQRAARHGHRFTLVYVGAPYATDLAERAARTIGTWPPLSPGAMVVVETYQREGLSECYGDLILGSTRDYSETRLFFYRFVPQGDEG